VRDGVESDGMVGVVMLVLCVLFREVDDFCECIEWLDACDERMERSLADGVP
jgi:hypothetical protein